MTLAIGGCTIAELQARMSYSEFVDWMAFAQGEPLGEARADLRNAQQMALLANVNRDSSKHPTPYAAKDFIPDWWGEATQAPTVNNVLDKFRAISARINAAAGASTNAD